MKASAELQEALSEWNRSPERELLVLLSGLAPSRSRLARAEHLLGDGLDPAHLQQIAIRHFVTPLLVRNLRRLGPDVFGAGNEQARTSRQLADEMLRIVRLLEQEGIPVAPYKGPLLAHLLYGEFALRPCGDLDFLVGRQHSDRARDLLLQAGYRPIRSLSPRRQRAASRSSAHHQLVREAPPIGVDLHWQILPDYSCVRFDSDALLKRTERVSLDGTSIRSFRPEDLLLILSAHTAKHFGERLIWIVDLAQLVKVYPRMDWRWVLAESSRLGIRRVLRVCLRLAEFLLEADLPDRIQDDLRTDPAVDPLSAEVLRSFWPAPLDGASWREKTGWFLSVRERWRDRAGYLLGLTRVYLTPTSHDWEFLPLPDPLFSLYYLVRPLRVCGKYGMTACRRLLPGTVFLREE